MSELAYVRDGAEIYRRSFAIIRHEADLANVPASLEQVVVRMIHASGMVDLVADIAFSTDLGIAGRQALHHGVVGIADRRPDHPAHLPCSQPLHASHADHDDRRHQLRRYHH